MGEGRIKGEVEGKLEDRVGRGEEGEEGKGDGSEEEGIVVRVMGKIEGEGG